MEVKNSVKKEREKKGILCYIRLENGENDTRSNKTKKLYIYILHGHEILWNQIQTDERLLTICVTTPNARA